MILWPATEKQGHALNTQTKLEVKQQYIQECHTTEWLSTRLLHYPKTVNSTQKVSRTTQLCCQWPHPAWKLDKNVFGKKPNRNRITHSAESHVKMGMMGQVHTFGYQDYTNKCRRISLMAACTPLIYCIGAAYLVTSPAERGMCQAGTFFQRKFHQQHPL